MKTILAVLLLISTNLFGAIGFSLADSAFVGNVRPPAGGGGGPTLIAQDNFDSYIDGSSLDDAADWVVVGGVFNVVKPASDGSVTAGDTSTKMAYNVATFNSNQRTEITIDAAAAGGNFDWVGPAVRVQEGANSGYAVVFSSTDLYLIKVNAGTQATIVSDTAVTLAAGNRVAIEASGSGSSTRLKVQLDTGSGWVDKWTNQDPAGTYLDGGHAGIGGWSLTGPNRLDDWKGYDL